MFLRMYHSVLLAWLGQHCPCDRTLSHLNLFVPRCRLSTSFQDVKLCITIGLLKLAWFDLEVTLEAFPRFSIMPLGSTRKQKCCISQELDNSPGITWESKLTYSWEFRKGRLCWDNPILLELDDFCTMRTPPGRMRCLKYWPSYLRICSLVSFCRKHIFPPLSDTKHLGLQPFVAVSSTAMLLFQVLASTPA